MARLPLTLLAGGPELAKLLGQVIDPPDACLVIGSQYTLERAGVPPSLRATVDSGSVPTTSERFTAEVTSTLARTAGRTTGIRRLIVALDETCDAAAVALAVLSDKALRELVRLDAVLVTVDAVQMSTRLMSGQPVETPHGLDRLAIADRIVVARSQDVTAPALGAIAHMLRSINQTGPIIAPAIAPCSVDDLLDLDAWSGPPAVGNRPAIASPFLGPGDPAMVVCRLDQPLDPGVVDRWFDRIVANHASDVLRILGAVSVKGDRRRTYVHGVRSCLIRSSEATEHPCQQDDQSLVAIIGRGLDESSIQASFASCHR